MPETPEKSEKKLSVPSKPLSLKGREAEERRIAEEEALLRKSRESAERSERDAAEARKADEEKRRKHELEAKVKAEQEAKKRFGEDATTAARPAPAVRPALE